MVTNILPLVGPDPYTPEWYELRTFDRDRERPFIFGASDAAAACGLSPFETRLGLYLRIRGEMGKQEETEAMKMGKILEPAVLAEYKRRTNCGMDAEVPMFFHGQLPYVACTPDARCWNTYEDTVVWGVDAKTTTWHRRDDLGDDTSRFGKDGTDQVPIDCYFQGQQQMWVMGWNRVDFPVLFDTRTMRIYQVPRDDQAIEAIRAAEAEMYERILNENPPEPDFRHSETYGLIRDMFDVNPEEVRELTEKDEAEWNEYQRIKSKMKVLEADAKELRNKVTYAMRGAGIGKLPSGAKKLKTICVKALLVSVDHVAQLQARVGKEMRESYSYVREVKA